MKEGKAHGPLEKLGSGRLGSHIEKLQYPGSSVCLFYTVEHGGVVIA